MDGRRAYKHGPYSCPVTMRKIRMTQRIDARLDRSLDPLGDLLPRIETRRSLGIYTISASPAASSGRFFLVPCSTGYF